MQSVAGKPVLVAGDPERAHIKKVQEKEGICYHINLMEAMVMTVCIFDCYDLCYPPFITRLLWHKG